MDSELERFALRQIEMALGPNFDPSDYDIEPLLSSVIKHQCAPFLNLYFSNRGFEIPEEIRIWNRDSAARTMLYTSILQQLISKLDIPWVVLKGIPLSEQLFGSTKWRQSTDLDVLINWEDLERSLEVLEEIGFHLERKIRPWAYNQIALRHKVHHATIELHWRLSLPYLPAPSTRSLLDEAIQFESKTIRGPVPTLSPDATFFNLVMHFHQHFSFIKGGIDLVAWMQLFDVQDGRDYCNAHGIGTLADVALSTTIIRGFNLDFFPKLSGNERRFLQKRVSAQGIFFDEKDNEYMNYWKQLQNALFLDKEDERAEGFKKGLLFGPHRFSDFLRRFS